MESMSVLVPLLKIRIRPESGGSAFSCLAIVEFARSQNLS